MTVMPEMKKYLSEAKSSDFVPKDPDGSPKLLGPRPATQKDKPLHYPSHHSEIAGGIDSSLDPS